MAYLHVGKSSAMGSVLVFMGALNRGHGPDLVATRFGPVLATTWPLILLSAVLLRAGGRCPDQWIYLVLGVAFSLMILRFHAEMS